MYNIKFQHRKIKHYFKNIPSKLLQALNFQTVLKGISLNFTTKKFIKSHPAY